MNPLKSVGARLGLALAVVVAAALALVDLIVVPSLQHRLIHAKIAQLRGAAPPIAAQYERAKIDLGRRSVEVRSRPVTLTYVEFELLRTLASHPGRVYSRRMLLEALWGAADYREPRTIDVHVRHLREKLERDPAEPEYILTVRGVGYRFRDR